METNSNNNNNNDNNSISNSKNVYSDGREENSDPRFKKQTSFFWSDVIACAIRAVGEEDAEPWIKSVESKLITHPNFIKDPGHATNEVLRLKDPKYQGTTWAWPHPESYHKLGYFVIWEKDHCYEVYGEDKTLGILNRDQIVEN